MPIHFCVFQMLNCSKFIYYVFACGFCKSSKTWFEILLQFSVENLKIILEKIYVWKTQISGYMAIKSLI